MTGNQGAPGAWRVLTNPHRFGVLFLGAAVSNIGTWCQNIAAILLVYQLTSSTFLVGMVTVAQFTAPLILGPAAGTVADRFDRRRVLTVTQIASSAASAFLAVLAFTDSATVPLVLLAVGLLGVCHSFHSPAQLSLVPLLTAREDREVALSVNSSQGNLARAIGPVVASGLIAVGGVQIAFAFNAASFLVYAAALQFIRPIPQQRPKRTPRFREVFPVLGRQPVVILLIVCGTLVGGSTDAIMTLGPGIAEKVTGSADAVGWFASAFGSGAVTTAFFLVPLLRRFSRRLMFLMGVQGAGTGLFALSPTYPLAMLGAFVAGAAFLAASNRALSILQTSVPGAVLGRVTSLWLMGFLGGRVIFAWLEGSLASAFGVEVAGLAVAAVLALGAVAVRMTRPMLANRATTP